MFSLERELIELRDAGTIDAATADTLIARERRDVVNVYSEMRMLTWAAVMTIVTGVGIIISENLDRIGPITLAAAIAAAAAACYAWAFWKRHREPSLADDYILLLAALLLSADVGYIEHTWHVLDRHWDQHLLILAVIHAVTAYCFDSRLVLSVSLTSLAAYFGFRRENAIFFGDATETGVRGLLCAAVILLWRFVDAHLRERRTFQALFEHFATNLAVGSALIFASGWNTPKVRYVLPIGLSILSGWYGVRTRREAFAVYGCVYGFLAVNQAMPYGNIKTKMFVGVVSAVAAIVTLFVIHARLRKEAMA